MLRIESKAESLGGWLAWDNSLLTWRAWLNDMPVRGGGRGGVEGTIFLEKSIRLASRGLGERRHDEPLWDEGTVRTMIALNAMLSDQGITLILVPVPSNLFIYPELTGQAPPNPPDVQYSRLLHAMLAGGVEVVDLYEPFIQNRHSGAELLYYRTDHHWSGRGIVLAAEIIANRILAVCDVRDARDQPALYTSELLVTKRWRGKLATGSLVEETPLEDISRYQVKNVEGDLHSEPSSSQILIVGDSFVQYRLFEGTATDIGPNLAYKLNMPVQSLSSNGILGIDLIRLIQRQGAELLTGKKAVIVVMMDVSLQDRN